MFYLPPPAQAQAHPAHAHAQAQETQAHTQAQLAHAHTHLVLFCIGCVDDFCLGVEGIIEFANFSRLTTKLFALFSMAVAILFAKSAPGIVGGFCP